MSETAQSPTPTVVLDHLAIAVTSWTDPKDVLVDALGGRWRYGIRTPAFNACQLAYGNDTRIELLTEPEQGSSFVTRFLATGPNRPHHITFKTDDLDAVLRDARAFGIEPVLVSLANPGWHEGFLHPRDTGLGVLIQVAQGSGDPTKGPGRHLLLDRPWTHEAEAEPSPLSYLVVRVRDLDRAARLFCEVLRAERLIVSDDLVRLRWPSGAHLLLIAESAYNGGTPRPLGVQDIAVEAPAPRDLPITPAGMGWSKTEVVPALGVSLLFNSVPALA
ncbi:MAG TPA: VOC family protein [Actinoplanes sp.]|jgi:methylmalonyl-CoA/ethylmalonyl-CoA epimerase